MDVDARLVFFGNERLVSGLPHTDAPILTALIEAGYEIKAVVSHHSDGTSRNNRSLEVADIAAQHNIPVLLPSKPIDIYDELVAMQADAAVLVAYGRIIPQKVIDIFPHGIINIHPSLLPKYRGPTPIESAIEHGDLETGVSIMQLSAGMDEGPVYVQQKIELHGTETKIGLYETMAGISAGLLVDTLPLILDDRITPREQHHEKATYSKLLSKNDAWLEPENIDAGAAERRIRAHAGFPKTKLRVLSHDIIITKAHVAHEVLTPLDIRCSDGAVLSIDELIAPSGKTMNADAFLRGYAAG